MRRISEWGGHVDSRINGQPVRLSAEVTRERDSTVYFLELSAIYFLEHGELYRESAVCSYDRSSKSLGIEAFIATEPFLLQYLITKHMGDFESNRICAPFRPALEALASYDPGCKPN